MVKSSTNEDDTPHILIMEIEEANYTNRKRKLQQEHSDNDMAFSNKK